MIDHTALEYIAVHSIVMQCTVYTQVSNGTFNDHRNFFEGLFLRILLEIFSVPYFGNFSYHY